MKVLGLGDNVFDVYQNLNLIFPGGNAINVSVNASKLNYESSYLGNIADDKYGYALKAILNHHEVDISHCYTINNSSTKRCIQEIKNGDKKFLSNDLGKNWAGVLEINEKDVLYLGQFDIIFSSCNAKIEDEFYKLGDIKGIIVYDFGEKEKYRTLDYYNKICPYIDLAQFSMSDKTIHEIQQFIDDFPFDIPVLITRGSQSVLYFHKDDKVEQKNHKIDVIDTMGAGDAFITAFACSLVEQGWHKGAMVEREWLVKSLRIASEFAAEICMIQGGIDHQFQNKELKAVIFDMDGVIVDSEIHWFNMFSNFISSFGKTLKPEDAKEFYGCSIEKEIEILSRYIDKTVEEISLEWKNYNNKQPIYYKKYLMDGVEGLLKYLKSKNIKLAIASSSSIEDISRMIKECHLDNIFDYIVSGQMFERSKPDPQVYNYTVDLLDIPRENIFVIEDSTHGLQAAVSAGLQVLALRNKAYSFDLGKAFMIFDSHQDILNYIKYVIYEGE